MKREPTELGQYLRKLRISHNEILADMAKKLKITPAYLSAIELGKRPIPDTLPGNLIEQYSIEKNEVVNLQGIIDRSTKMLTIDMENLSAKGRETALAFARKLQNIDEAQLESIFDFLKKERN